MRKGEKLYEFLMKRALKNVYDKDDKNEVCREIIYQLRWYVSDKMLIKIMEDDEKDDD